MDIDQFIFGIAVIFGFVAFYVIIPISMAERRNRSRVAWLFVSLVISPLMAIIGLWVLGEKE